MKRHLLKAVGVFCALTLLSGCNNASDERLTPKIIRKKILANANSQPKPVTGRSATARPANQLNARTLPTPGTGSDSSQPSPAGDRPLVAQKGDDSRPATPAAPAGTFGQNPANVASPPSAAAEPTGPMLVTRKVDSEAVRPTPEVFAKPDLVPKSDVSMPRQPVSADASMADTTVAALMPQGADSEPFSDQRPMYNPFGKIDPFEPLFKDKADDGNLQARRKKRVPRTPLEKIDLSQLKLVGIILAVNGNRALVEEASGKGYVIEKGTYIGVNSGKVIDILRDKVVIEEEDEDIFGKVVVRKKEIKIPKPPGEL